MSTALEHADVVVVGAGLGGLCTAAYLAVAGKRVVVVDRHSVAGGNGTVFTHEGYEFDVGLHYIGDCGPDGGIPRVLAPLGIELTYREMDPDGFDTFVFDDGTRFAVPAGVDAFRDRLHGAFPDEAAGIDAYLDLVTGIDGELSGGGPGPVVVEHLSTTLGEVFDELGLSPRLRTVLSGQHGTYALPPSKVSMLLHAALVMHYLKGAFYPEGGGQVIADRLVEVIEAHGGTIVVADPGGGDPRRTGRRRAGGGGGAPARAVVEAGGGGARGDPGAGGGVQRRPAGHRHPAVAAGVAARRRGGHGRGLRDDAAVVRRLSDPGP